jgi:hypothetical protein
VSCVSVCFCVFLFPLLFSLCLHPLVVSKLIDVVVVVVAAFVYLCSCSKRYSFTRNSSLITRRVKCQDHVTLKKDQKTQYNLTSNIYI